MELTVLGVLVAPERHSCSYSVGNPLSYDPRTHKLNIVRLPDDSFVGYAQSSYSVHTPSVVSLDVLDAWPVGHQLLCYEVLVLFVMQDASHSSVACSCSLSLQLLLFCGQLLKLAGRYRTGWTQAFLEYPTADLTENDKPCQFLWRSVLGRIGSI